MKAAITRMLLVLVMAVAGVVIGGQVSAQAACSGAGCAGLDPQAQGCTSSATDLTATRHTSTGAVRFTAHVRSSSACNARWTRVVLEANACCYTREFAVESQRWFNSNWIASDFRTVTIPSNSVGTYWTNMVDNRSDDRVRVCDQTIPDGGWSCGPWTA
ncbi:DUF2690 domain-containing protein [Lentzea sp.]|uniref:DUF2690 domain-containing protein n=1 Tax=Lentzea sp. TaxID=56099 RepID=UPI002D05B6AC|nr:DUF2690 domain-containing protein [Lentzea sp.]HUQ56724.1 DUF2690 domain-containing protein [Lentzea sp.]